MTRRKKSSVSSVPARPAGAPQRCVIYCRVSSEAQRDRHTIESQHRELPPLVKGLANVEVVAVLEDNGLSGASLDRPTFVDIMGMAKRYEFELLAVVAIDRITRAEDETERALILGHFRDCGVRIWTPSSGIMDLNNPEHRFMSGIKTQFAAYESAMLRIRTRAGKITAAPKSNRRLCARDPYGLRWAPSADSREGAYVVVEPEAEVVRLAFALAPQMGIARIAAELNARGLRTRPVLRWTNPRHGAKQRRSEPARWTNDGVRRILRSTTYRGTVVTFRDSARIVKNVPAIVEAHVWDAAQASLAGRYVERRTKHVDCYLLRGLLSCALCGQSAEVMAPAPQRAYYRCRTAAKWKQWGLSETCPCQYVRVADADAAVWAAMEEIIRRPDLLLSAVPLSQVADTSHWHQQAAEAAAKLKRLKIALATTLDLQRSGELEPDMVKAEVGRNAVERKDAERKLQVAQQHIDDVDAHVRVQRDSQAFAADLLAALRDDQTFELRRRLLTRIIRPDRGGRILMDGTGIRIRAAVTLGDATFPIVTWQVPQLSAAKTA